MYRPAGSHPLLAATPCTGGLIIRPSGALSMVFWELSAGFRAVRRPQVFAAGRTRHLGCLSGRTDGAGIMEPVSDQGPQATPLEIKAQAIALMVQGYPC